MKLSRATQQAEAPDDRQAAGKLEEAFARHQDELLGTLYYLVGNAEDARDALQDTFVKCWRHRSTLGQIDNLKAWIFRIALNTGKDIRGEAWRRRRLPLVGENSMPATRQADPLAELEQQEELEQVRQALRNLRPEEQQVFLLRQNAQMTYDEIALTIGIPSGTVKTRMRLALGKLRAALAAT